MKEHKGQFRIARLVVWLIIIASAYALYSLYRPDAADNAAQQAEAIVARERLIALAEEERVLEEEIEALEAEQANPTRRISYRSKSSLKGHGDGEKLAEDIAQECIRSGYATDVIFLSGKVGREQGITGRIWQWLLSGRKVTISYTGKLRHQGKKRRFRLVYVIEGIDEYQTVYYVTDWTIK